QIGACFDKPPGYACARGAGRKGGSALHCVGHGYDENRTGKFCISHNVAMMRFSLSDRRERTSLWARLLSDRKGTGFCLTTQPALPHGDGRMRYGETFGRWIPSEKIAPHNSTSLATASSFQRPRTLDHRGAKHETLVSQR